MKEKIKSDWFPHDYNSRADTKVVKIISKYEMEGYGIYWAFIEHLYKNEGVINKNDVKYIAKSFNTSEEKLNEIIYSGLFIINGEEITSDRVSKEIDKRETIIKVKTSAANKRWSKYQKMENLKE